MSDSESSELPYVPPPKYCHPYDIGCDSDIRGSICRLHQNGKYSDLTIICKEARFNVHKLIVSAQSKVFAAMIDGGFREAKTACINLPDDDPKMIDYLVQFLYSGNYGPGSGWPEEGNIRTPESVQHKEIEELPCIVHAQVYALADKYDIPSLLRKSAQNFVIRTAQLRAWNPFSFYVEVLDSIPTIYTIPTTIEKKDLRGLASGIMSEVATEMERMTTISTGLKDLRERIMKTTPEFCYDVATLLFRRASPICGDCVEANESMEVQYNIGLMKCAICSMPKAACRVNGRE